MVGGVESGLTVLFWAKPKPLSRKYCIYFSVIIFAITLCNKDSGAWDISTDSISLRVAYN